MPEDIPASNTRFADRLKRAVGIILALLGLSVALLTFLPGFPTAGIALCQGVGTSLVAAGLTAMVVRKWLTDVQHEETRNIVSEALKRQGAFRVKLLADVTDNKIGLERVWPRRGEWTGDEHDGHEVWDRRLCEAKERVDIMSSTLSVY